MNSEFKIDFFCMDKFWKISLLVKWGFIVYLVKIVITIWYIEPGAIFWSSKYHMTPVSSLLFHNISSTCQKKSERLCSLLVIIYRIQNIPPCSGISHRKINWKPSHFWLWALGFWKVLAMTLLLPDSTKPNLFIFLPSIFHLFQPYFGISKNFTRK